MSVKVIKATGDSSVIPSQKTKALLRVAAYCRVSTDSDEQETSYEAQVNHYTSHIESNPEWTLAGIFADEGLSGTQTKTRPNFNRMIEACERHEIDLVITKSISRFSRNTLDCLKYIRMLKELGIPIIFEKEAINTMEASGEILVTILASIAQQESASISANVRMGINFRFQEGHGRLNYSQFLGYKGGGAPGVWVIDPAEADIVRRIYREYLEGFSPNLIAKRLEEEGICSPTGGDKWYASTVNSMLGNERYAGDLLMQKYYTEDYLTHHKVKNHGQRPQYFVEDNHEPIVPKAIYYQVQGERKRRAALKLDPSRLRFGDRIALNGRLICGKCGRTLKRYVKPEGTATDWRCRKRALIKKSAIKEQPSIRCDCRIVKETEVQKAVLEAFNALPSRREELIIMDEHLLSGEIGRLDAMFEMLTDQETQVEDRLKMLEAQNKLLNVGEEEVNGARQEIPGESTEIDFLEAQIISIRDKKDALYAERAKYANREVQVRILLELVDQMVAAPSSAWHVLLEGTMEKEASDSPACYDYEDFFHRTKYTVPKDILGGDGKMILFSNDLVIRYLDRIMVHDWGFEVAFKAGIEMKVEK